MTENGRHYAAMRTYRGQQDLRLAIWGDQPSDPMPSADGSIDLRMDAFVESTIRADLLNDHHSPGRRIA